jgi:hypothetical protein
MLADVFSGGPALSWLALEVAVSTGTPVPLAKLHQLAANVPPERVLFFVRALGRLREPSARTLLSRWYNSPDPCIRREAALADLLLGPADAGVHILQTLPYDESMLLPASLVVDVRQSPQLLARAKVAKGSDAILAMAMAGDPGAIPWLLEQIENETTAGMAACALELLLGASLFETHELPDEDRAAAPRKAPRVSRNRANWTPIAERVLARHPKGVMLRAGLPAAATATLSLLERPHLPTIARSYLGYELAIRWKLSPLFDATAVLRVQREQLSIKC